MKRFFKWLYETYSCRMFQWKYELSRKQLDKIEERINRYKYDIKTNYAGEFTIEIPNILL